MTMLTEVEKQEIEKEARDYSLTKPDRNAALTESDYITGATIWAKRKNIEAESRECLLEEYSSALLSLRKRTMPR